MAGVEAEAVLKLDQIVLTSGLMPSGGLWISIGERQEEAQH